MKKILLAAALCSSLLMANESSNIIRSSAYGTTVITEVKAPVYNRKVKEYYKDETIFNYILLSRQINEKPYRNIKDSKLIALIKEEDIQKQSKEAAKDISLSVQGYCNVSENIHVGKQPMSAFMSCKTNLGYITIFGNIIPKNELLSIFFDPQYIEYNNSKFQVLKESITTNENRTSYNIATFVNDRKLSEIGYAGAIASTNIIQKTTHSYLDAIEKSKTSKGVEYSNTGSNNNNATAIQTEKTERPRAEDYLVKAGIDILAGVIKSSSEIFRKDLPYLYEVKKNSKIYIDLKINKNGVQIK